MRVRRGLTIAAAGGFLLAGCGGDDGGGGAAPSGDGDAVVVEAYDRLDFDADSYTVPAGETTFEYVQKGMLPHTLLVEGSEGDMELLVSGPGQVDRGSITLEAGRYVLYCDVAGHRAGGMEAELIVE
jgi:plastocyanin